MKRSTSGTSAEQYVALGHAVQSGVAMEMELGSQASTPKHLRTGLDMRAADMEGLVTLLIEKGVFSTEEYAAAILASAEWEVARYEARLTRRLGRPVQLA
jgi:hypothetical protein